MAFDWKEFFRPTKTKLILFALFFILFAPCVQMGFWRWNPDERVMMHYNIHNESIMYFIWGSPVEAAVGINMGNFATGAILCYLLASILAYFLVPVLASQAKKRK